MVRVFKNGSKTIYAITGKHDAQADVYRELAAYKKESFEKVVKKFNLKLGYIKKHGDIDELYMLEIGKLVPVRCTPCIIAFKGESL